MRNNIEAERGRLQMTKEKLSNELGISSKTYLSYVRGKQSFLIGILILNIFRSSRSRKLFSTT